MKKKLLPLAMLAGLAGAVGTAQAAHLNSDGLGQVLIYPYYTTLNGQHTDIHLVNTTNETKAVKIRFLEGQNSKEVLDFHIYLSAYDHFSGVVTATGEGEDRVALFRTGDTTCTVPALSAEGQPFSNYAYKAVYSPNPGGSHLPQILEQGDAGIDSLSRTLEGYIEVIEMGVLGTESASGQVTEVNGNTAAGSFRPATAAKHVLKDGKPVPNNCNVLVDAWSTGVTGGGQWLTSAADGVRAGTGGLYGFASVFNVSEGTSVTYSATAIADFNTTDLLHFEPGNVDPSLVNVSPIANVINGNEVVSTGFTNRVDAVSALLTRDTLKNDYVTDEGLNAETDWVITFPTKRFYVEETVLADRKPFTSEFTANLACEHIDLVQYDREEQTKTTAGRPQFSPAPVVVNDWVLCSEVNVLSFGANSNVLSSSLRYGYPVSFKNGWASINLANPGSGSGKNARNVAGIGLDDTGNPVTPGRTDTYHGLPVAGFGVIKYKNGTLANGVLSNYTGVVDHKYTRRITN